MNSFQLKTRVSIHSPEFQDVEINSGDKIYFMGICGTAMASFAVYLKKSGFDVFGSDQNVYPPMSDLLKKADIPLFSYDKKNLNSEIKVAIIGNVIQKINPEVEVLEKLKIPYISLPEFLEQTLIKNTKNLVVTGTHGKSTTASLMTQVAQTVNGDASHFIAALSKNFEIPFHVSNQEWFILEGDEYDTAFFSKIPKFLYYNPFALILTSVEFDHGDIYKNFEEVKSAFKKLIQSLSKDNYLIACYEDQTVRELSALSPAPVISYGIQQGDYQIRNRQIIKDKQSFDVYHKNQKIGNCALSLMGEHNALNALSVIALSCTLKWPLEQIFKGLEQFKNLERRLQKRGEYNQVLLYEDFAHHPTAVKSTLNALREKYPNKRILALFEPRSFTSRLNVFQKQYSESFDAADVVIISKPFNVSKIEESKRFSSQNLVKDLKKKGKLAYFERDVESIKSKVFSIVKEGDLILVMSNGSFDGLLSHLLKSFRTK